MTKRCPIFCVALVAILCCVGCPSNPVAPVAQLTPSVTDTPTETPVKEVPDVTEQHAPAAQSGEIDTLVHGNTAFACALYKQLSADEGNLFVSPYSISAALAMTYAGARGETAAQMAGALHFDLAPDRLHPAFGELQRALVAGAGEDYALDIANALWSQIGFQFLKSFIALGVNDYDAMLRELDFAGDPELSRRTINGWISDRTREKIPELLSQGAIRPDTRLVLTNAIYFKGTWVDAFDPKRTRDLPFHLTPEKSIQTPMMFRDGKYAYAETEDIQALELPYRGEDLSMVVVLPKQVDGLTALERSLTPDALAEWTQSLASSEVDVYLPKFTFRDQSTLNGVLAQMGMTDAFGSGADFSGMTGRRDLYLSVVVHEAFVEVNEEGTEAAAATGVVATLTSLRPAQPVFRADRPFLFLIRERATGAILFMGRVADPKT